MIAHILERGSITSRQIAELFGYEHSPRVDRDIHEYGIPLVTETIVEEDGRRKYGSRCFIYNELMEESLLQVDHRIPYEIGGNPGEDNIDCFMLLCPFANRAKSWACENCKNWSVKDPQVGATCYWAHPEGYEYIAGRDVEMVAVNFTGSEIEDYFRLISLSGPEDAQKHMKEMLHRYLSELNNDKAQLHARDKRLSKL